MENATLDYSLTDGHITNITSLNNNTAPYIPLDIGLTTGTWCESFNNPHHWLFQLANICFLIGYAVPTTKYCILIMHSFVIIGFLMITAWAWSIMCAPDIFIWNLTFLFINIIYMFYIIYQMRPIRFDPELEDVYHTLFQPLKVTRRQFKKLVSDQFADIMSLHAGEAYAMQNITRTDRLALLITGKVNVFSDHQFLHAVVPCEFLDSPEFECRVNDDDKFKVSIIAAVPCRYLVWQRSSLEYLFIKETYLSSVIALLVSSDVTNKVYTINNTKIVAEQGFRLDIRLPAVATAMAMSRDRPNSTKFFRKHGELLSNTCSSSPESVASSRERLLKNMKNSPLPNGKLSEMETVAEFPSTDDLTSAASGVESWLDTSSKYHSCELLES